MPDTPEVIYVCTACGLFSEEQPDECLCGNTDFQEQELPRGEPEW